MKQALYIAFFVFSIPCSALTFSYGKYVGNDGATQAITGIGFQPDLLIVKADGAYQGWMVHKDMSAGNAKGLVGTGALVTGRISTIDADGFTVGTHDEANKASVEYYFIAFDASSDFVLGSFVGTGAKTISGLSFQPEMVWLMGAASGDNACAVLRPDGHDNATLAWDGYDAWDHIATFESDGFTTNWRTNGSDTYYWVAIDASASNLELGEFVGDGNDNYNITAPGFQPDFSMVIANGGANPQFRLGNMPINESLEFAAVGAAANKIQQTMATGLQVGDDATVNELNTKITWLAYGGGTNVLPVELVNFKLNTTVEGKIIVAWQTASEINSSRFEIERASRGMDFTVMDEVQAAGSSTEQIDYSIIDEDPIDGINYYRIKAIDLDGSFEYSEIKTVSLESNSIGELQVSPNPARDEISLSFELSKGDIYSLQVVGSDGVIVYQGNVVGYEGVNEIDLNISSYIYGVYYINFFSSENTNFKGIKFVKN